MPFPAPICKAGIGRYLAILAAEANLLFIPGLVKLIKKKIAFGWGPIVTHH
jgi:hypothetical protein